MTKLTVSEIRQAIRVLSVFDENAVQCILQTMSCRLAQDNDFQTMDDARDVVDQLDEIINNLDDMVAGSEPGICPACNGSGEGMHEGTTCYSCKGQGEC